MLLGWSQQFLFLFVERPLLFHTSSLVSLPRTSERPNVNALRFIFLVVGVSLPLEGRRLRQFSRRKVEPFAEGHHLHPRVRPCVHVDLDHKLEDWLD